jgi:light-regulated signal transduction histidine kinase (bacteriophytochrome)
VASCPFCLRCVSAKAATGKVGIGGAPSPTHRGAQAANDQLESFSYSVSHDLRAPLRHIEGFVRILLGNYSTELPAEAQRLLHNVSSSTSRMGQLIDDLLRFSWLGRQPLSKKAVNLAALVKNVFEELRKELASRNIDFHVRALPVCQGDPSLLKQVFVNLLSNSLKFTRHRATATIEVDCQRLEEQTVYSVRDNGVGFDMQYAQKLFGVFQRFHSSSEFEGTGIGLSIVQRIIQRHGGRIWAEAEVDKGAAFFFTLPDSQSSQALTDLPEP